MDHSPIDGFYDLSFCPGRRKAYLSSSVSLDHSHNDIELFTLTTSSYLP
ncbi:hypothetical protein [Leptolyngbya ohadii]|nr:hypothetical protein [Leptolyngbya ohadii]